MARDPEEHHVRVNCVVPGNPRTHHRPEWYLFEGEAEIDPGQCLKGRLGPDDIAELLLFPTSADARLMTGHEQVIDAGWR